jgi:hypothetical protein
VAQAAALSLCLLEPANAWRGEELLTVFIQHLLKVVRHFVLAIQEGAKREERLSEAEIARGATL